MKVKILTQFEAGGVTYAPGQTFEGDKVNEHLKMEAENPRRFLVEDITASSEQEKAEDEEKAAAKELIVEAHRVAAELKIETAQKLVDTEEELDSVKEQLAGLETTFEDYKKDAEVKLAAAIVAKAKPQPAKR